MEITSSKAFSLAAFAAIAFVAVFTVAFAVTPLALAASSGSNYPIEIMRAHTTYTVVDPAPAVQIGVGVRGAR